MKRIQLLSLMALTAAWFWGGQAWAVTGIQVGSSGKTYASSGVQCSLHPVAGMSPVVQAGLYNPKRSTTATVSLNGLSIDTVTFFRPDTNVWLVNGPNTVVVSLNKRSTDSYTFEATSSQANICLPDTTGNVVIGDLEYAASNNVYATTYATVSPGCALNPLSGKAQPFINLFDSSNSVFNVSVNNVPLTQLSGTRPHTPVFLSPGWNVIFAANVGLSINDYYVRDGGNGSCSLP